MFVCLYIPIWKATVSTLCVFSLQASRDALEVALRTLRAQADEKEAKQSRLKVKVICHQHCQH